MTRQHCLQGAVETEPTSTRSGFRFGKFCLTKLLCIFFSVVIGLGCSAFALSSYGSGVSELLDAVSVHGHEHKPGHKRGHGHEHERGHGLSTWAEWQRSQTLFNYQLPAIVACSLQPFLEKCKRDLARPPPPPPPSPLPQHTLLDCAMKRFLTQRDDAQLQRCVEHDEATNQAPDMLRLATALANSTGCLPWAGSVSKLPPVWIGVSVKDQPLDLARFLLHHWCMGVHRFLIYDESTSSSVQQMAVQAQTMIPINYTRAPPKSQVAMQVDAIKRAAQGGAQWVGGLDVDEYLHVPGADLPALLHSLPSHVGVASFKWEMFPAATSYDVLSDGQRGSHNIHVKSFSHVKRVKLAPTDPHHKRLKEGYHQLLMGPNQTMPNGPFATRNGQPPKRGESGEFRILPKHPSCLHFHEKPTLADAVRKRYRGTGDVRKPSDTMPLEQTLWTLSEVFVRRSNRHVNATVGAAAGAKRTTSFDPAFAALVEAVGRYTSNLSGTELRDRLRLTRRRL